MKSVLQSLHALMVVVSLLTLSVCSVEFPSPGCTVVTEKININNYINCISNNSANSRDSIVAFYT